MHGDAPTQSHVLHQGLLIKTLQLILQAFTCINLLLMQCMLLPTHETAVLTSALTSPYKQQEPDAFSSHSAAHCNLHMPTAVGFAWLQALLMYVGLVSPVGLLDITWSSF